MEIFKYIEMNVEKCLCQNIKITQKVYKDCIKKREYKNMYNV